MSKIGIGAATIDLVLETDTVRMGETVRGELVVTGGEVEQAIEGIQVDLVVTSQYEVDDAVRHVRETVARQTISDAFVLHPGETKTYPFAFAIPIFPHRVAARAARRAGLPVRSAQNPDRRGGVF